MPLVRGRVLPEIESTGRVKRTLDVLIYVEKIDRPTAVSFDELEQLRIYLSVFQPPICTIRLLAPTDHAETITALEAMDIGVVGIPEATRVDQWAKDVAAGLTDPLKAVLATALSNDADCVVVSDPGLLAYVDDFNKAGVLLTSHDFLPRYAETFVRGHDVPWAFAHKVWFGPWMSFYQLSEQWTFKTGMDFLNLCQSKGASRDSLELCRSLSLNRLGDLCFTRDRLCFYEMQQAAAKRARWKRQRFSAEIAYHLNFYYLLLYGAFDHAAAAVNALFNLGIKERQVTARNPEFLKALGERGLSGVQAVFEDPTHVEFIRRVAAVRHTAAHRGVLTPTKVVQSLDNPPTNEELDQDIRDAGLDYLLEGFRPGHSRDAFREMLRSNARAARYEKETLMEDVILIENDGGYAFIHPLNDTWWNFRRCTTFLRDVFDGCSKAL
ncbi:MAG: hypothetical protein WA232_00155 [Candidatus Sulfotelmatobacter sp.]